MTPTEAPSNPAPGASRPRNATSPLVRVAASLAILVLSGYIGYQGWTLHREWRMLQGELSLVDRSAVIGYININPQMTYARHPAKFLFERDNEAFLWAGWKSNEHQWFHLPKGQLNLDRFSTPMGRDAMRAIDTPIVEVAGGLRWGRIPDEAAIVGVRHNGADLAYPVRVLEKVAVVNDTIDGVPLLVTFGPFEILSEAVAVFEPILDGKRVTLGHSGYFIDRKPVLYDRETESFWLKNNEGLEAIAGARKGATLKNAGPFETVSWSDWRNRFPKSRLLIGADRAAAPSDGEVVPASATR